MLRIASFRAKATGLGPLPIDRVAEHMIVDHDRHLDSEVCVGKRKASGVFVAKIVAKGRYMW